MNKSQKVLVAAILTTTGWLISMYLSINLFIWLMPDHKYGELIPMLYGISVSCLYLLGVLYWTLGKLKD